MNAADLLTDLRALGANVTSPDGIALHVDAPAGAVTESHRQQIAELKPELLRLVTPAPPELPAWLDVEPASVLDMEIGPDGWPVGSVLMSDLTPCKRCGRLDLRQNLLGEWQCNVCDPITERAVRFIGQTVGDEEEGGDRTGEDASQAGCDDETNEFFWGQIEEEQSKYLTPSLHGEPSTLPLPCPWCGGFYRHSPLCDDLRAEWEPTVPFGRCKGQKLSATPEETLRWLLRCGVGDELRTAIAKELETRRRRYLQ